MRLMLLWAPAVQAVISGVTNPQAIQQLQPAAILHLVEMLPGNAATTEPVKAAMQTLQSQARVLVETQDRLNLQARVLPLLLLRVILGHILVIMCNWQHST